MRCPGSDLSRKKPEDIAYELPCPSCGGMIEFFFDDISRACPSCRTKVEKDYAHLLKDYGCALWCAEAEKCLGSEVYRRFIEAKERHKANDKKSIDDIVKP